VGGGAGGGGAAADGGEAGGAAAGGAAREAGVKRASSIGGLISILVKVIFCVWALPLIDDSIWKVYFTPTGSR